MVKLIGVQYLFVASGSITVFILTLILGKKNKAIADYILSGILLVLLINFSSLFILNFTVQPFPVWKELIFEFSESSIFLYGPLLWLYCLSLTKEDFVIETKYVLHFIPFLLSYLYFILGVMTFLNTEGSIRNFLLIMKIISVLVYSVWSLKLLNKHEQKIEQIFSNLDQKKLTWIKFMCWSVLFIVSIAVASLLVDRLTSFSIPQYGGILTNIALCIFVYVMGYFGFKQEFIFRTINTKQIEKAKYSKSGFKSEDIESAYHDLEYFIEKEKPYLDSELTLYGLADQLDLRPNHLSQIINSRSGSNFYDFINRYRVEEAKQKIKDQESIQFTLLGIGLSSGFSSKSTFNRAFKKYTGFTPSEYKNKNQC